MKILYSGWKKARFVLLACLFPACQAESVKFSAPVEVHNSEPELRDIPAFQEVLDRHKLDGSILIFHADSNYYSGVNFEHANRGFVPASTFKIPNSMIALETGVVADLNQVFKWDGEPHRIKSWEKDLTFHEAFQVSCLPCYKEVARKVGLKRMQEYLGKLGFGRMEVTDSTLDTFWLLGDSRISQMEQIDFLRRYYKGELDLKETTYEKMKALMLMDDLENQQLSGKTGWGFEGDLDIGWFVGFVEKKGKVWYFATNVSPQPEFDMHDFYKARKEVTFEALEILEIISRPQ